MIRYSTCVTGNKTDRARCFIPFYNEGFFVTAREDGEVVKEPKQMKFPIKLNEAEEATRANTTYVKVNVVDYFDSEPERLLGTYSVINQRLIKPKNLSDEGEEACQFLAYLTNVCSETARSTLDAVKKEARQELWDEQFAGNGQIDVEEDAVVDDEQNLYNLIDGDWDVVPEGHNGVPEYKQHLLSEYKRRVLNGLNQISFGADSYRAHTIQKKYLREQIVKPYDASVEAAFRRVDVLVNMLEQFPPSCKRATKANATQWLLFEDERRLDSGEVRDIKFNMLPPSYQERIDNLEEDWTEMSSSKFLAEAQKCEASDLRERNKKKYEKSKKAEKSSKKKKRDRNGAEDDGDEEPTKRSKNGNFKSRNRSDNQGRAQPTRECILCKLAGAPEGVYKSHSTDQCRKMESHSKKLQSRSSSHFEKGRNKGGEQRFTERDDDKEGELNLIARTRRLEKQLKQVSLKNKKKSKKGKKKRSQSGYDTSSSLWDIRSSSEEDSDF